MLLRDLYAAACRKNVLCDGFQSRLWMRSGAPPAFVRKPMVECCCFWQPVGIAA